MARWFENVERWASHVLRKRFEYFDVLIVDRRLLYSSKTRGRKPEGLTDPIYFASYDPYLPTNGP
ncbi:MAG: hypothetical protein VX694_10945 [Planctomycetota bacterium]|nr:hypothetical protein [Planctomycetota bacterium]MEC7679778.1 hypothetical protein [Planctomycetota bacterium]